MMKLKKAYLLLAGLLLLVSLSTAKTIEKEKANQDKPNIIFVLVDDLGFADINSFDPLGRTFYETPHIDKLSEQGMMFTQAYANAANCAPSRAAIMSGQSYPHQPIYHVGTPGKGAMISAPNATALPLEKITLAEALKGAGYHTGFIGKWHIGDPPEAGPKQQGFDVNIGGYNTGNPRGWEGEYFQPNNNPYITDADDGEYLTDYLTRKAVAYIKKHQTDPFYLQLSYYTPHSPFQAPKPLIQKYKEKESIDGHNHATYAAMLESLDRNVGQLMHTLKELDMEENTMVIFFSDNGGVGGYDFLGRPVADITDNAPLKGGKTTYYEGGIRVPLIMRWPRVIDAGTTSKEPVAGTDFYPTLLEAAGIEKAENYILDGKSLLPLLKNSNAKLEDRPLYWHFPGYPNNAWRTGPVSVIRSGPWKLMKFYETNDLQLYNLNEDIGEENDLSDRMPQQRDKLKRQLEDWLEKTGAPLPQWP